METKKVVTYYIPVMPITLLLLILKLAGVADISWFWVFFPLWIFPAIGIGLLLFFALFMLIIALIVGLTT